MPAERLLNERTHDTNNVCNREGALKRRNVRDNVSRVEQEAAQSDGVAIITRIECNVTRRDIKFVLLIVSIANLIPR